MADPITQRYPCRQRHLLLVIPLQELYQVRVLGNQYYHTPLKYMQYVPYGLCNRINDEWIIQVVAGDHEKVAPI